MLDLHVSLFHSHEPIHLEHCEPEHKDREPDKANGIENVEEDSAPVPPSRGLGVEHPPEPKADKLRNEKHEIVLEHKRYPHYVDGCRVSQPVRDTVERFVLAGSPGRNRDQQRLDYQDNKEEDETSEVVHQLLIAEAEC